MTSIEPICHICNFRMTMSSFIIDCQKFDVQRTDLVSFTTIHGVILNLQSVQRTENVGLIKLVTQFFFFLEQRQLSRSFRNRTILGYIIFKRLNLWVT
jgi:hypothetical protein